MIIVATSANWRKTRNPIHVDGRIAVTDFKVNSRQSVISGVI